jgi:four helix bundle protein
MLFRMSNPKIKTYRDLLVWDKAVDLAVSVYRFSEELEGRRLFALTDQINRAAVSVPSNIAEGYGRYSRGDYMRFVGIANGSLCEVGTGLTIARRIDPRWGGKVDAILESSGEVGRMLAALHRALKNGPARPG